MHTNVKTVLGISLFFFFGFLAFSELVGNYALIISKPLTTRSLYLITSSLNYLLSYSYHYSSRLVGECGPGKVTGH